MNKAFEYRIYPSAKQQELLQKTFGCCRYVYNKVLGMRQDEYKKNKSTESINSYITQIPVWKKTETPWLSEVDSQALQQSVRDLDKAYKNFFRNPGKVGFPKFKSKHSNRKSYRTTKIVIVDKRHVKLPKLGIVKARISRSIEGRVLSATVKQTPSGKYFVSICCADVPNPAQPKALLDMLGIDAGIHAVATCSNGVTIANPKYLAKNEKKLAREQRRLSRKKKASANREKQRVRVARVHEKIANQRKDTLHKFSTYAVRESQAIAVEDLNVEGMKRNHRLAKALSDASHDRDLNAAKNIAEEGERLLGRAGHARTVQNASGVGVRPSNGQSTLKEESPVFRHGECQNCEYECSCAKEDLCCCDNPDVFEDCHVAYDGWHEAEDEDDWEGIGYYGAVGDVRSPRTQLGIPRVERARNDQ